MGPILDRGRSDDTSSCGVEPVTVKRLPLLPSAAAVAAIAAVAAAFLVVAWGNDLRARSGRQVETWPSGKLRSEAEALRYPDGRVEREGPYTEYHESGAVHLRGQYHHGLPEGRWREYDEKGVLRKEGSYHKGKQDGLWHYTNPGADPEHEELLWDHGRVVESDGRRVEVGSGQPPVDLPWISHLLGTLYALLWITAPLPLLLALERRETGPPSAGGWTLPVVSLAVGWMSVQLMVGLVLALLHALARAPFLAVEAGLLVAGLALWLRQGCPLPSVPSSWRRDPAQTALLTAAVILALAVAVKTLLTPMSDWDGLAYHLPLVAEWVQHHRLVDVPALGQTARYPSSWEVISLGGFFPFAEDLLVTLPAVGAWILLGVSVHGLARRLGASGTAAAAVALILLSVPVVLLQTEELKADLPAAAFFLSALLLGGFLSPTRSGVRWTSFLFALALLCGVKASGPAYALLVVAAVAWWRWSRTRTDARTDARATEAPGPGGPDEEEAETAPSAAATEANRPSGVPGKLGLAVTLLAALLLASFWYLRNLLELGNPLGHVELSILGHRLLAGGISRAQLIHTTLFALLRPFDGADLRALWTASRQWLGAGFALLALSAAVALASAWLRRERRGIATALFLMLMVLFVLYGITPFSGDNGSHGWRITPWVGQAFRYGLSGMALLAVVAAWGWRRLRLSPPMTAAVAVGLTAWSAALRVAPPRLLLVVVVVLGAFAVLIWVARAGEGNAAGHGSRRRTAVFLTTVLSLALVVGGLHALRAGREQRRRLLYDLPYLRTLTAPPQEVVGVAMTQLRYPFYGRNWQRRVVDVSSHDGFESSWLRRLDGEGVDVVAIGPHAVHRTFAPPEADLHRWLDDSDGPFVRLPGVGNKAAGNIVFYRYRGGKTSLWPGPKGRPIESSRPDREGTRPREEPR